MLCHFIYGCNILPLKTSPYHPLSFHVIPPGTHPLLPILNGAVCRGEGQATNTSYWSRTFLLSVSLQNCGLALGRKPALKWKSCWAPWSIIFWWPTLVSFSSCLNLDESCFNSTDTSEWLIIFNESLFEGVSEEVSQGMISQLLRAQC